MCSPLQYTLHSPEALSAASCLVCNFHTTAAIFCVPSNDGSLEHTWVVDAHSAHAVEDGHGEVEHSRGPDEDALREHRAEDHHGDDGCREVDDVVWRVDDPGVDDAKHNTPAHVHGQASDPGPCLM